MLKADGLAAGKGVIICATEAEAREAVDVFFTEQRFGETEVVLEEFLEGEELSLLALCDGENGRCRWPRPRTTSGSSTATPGRTPAAWAATRRCPTSARPARGARRRRPPADRRPDGAPRHPFHGVLYAGLMMTADGPKVLEFNTRFGDPETQAVLPRLRSDLVELFLAASRARRAGRTAKPSFGDDWAVTVVLASAGYPASSSKGDVITGLDEAAASSPR